MRGRLWHLASLRCFLCFCTLVSFAPSWNCFFFLCLLTHYPSPRNTKKEKNIIFLFVPSKFQPRIELFYSFLMKIGTKNTSCFINLLLSAIVWAVVFIFPLGFSNAFFFYSSVYRLLQFIVACTVSEIHFRNLFFEISRHPYFTSCLSFILSLSMCWPEVDIIWPCADLRLKESLV